MEAADTRGRKVAKEKKKMRGRSKVSPTSTHPNTPCHILVARKIAHPLLGTNFAAGCLSNGDGVNAERRARVYGRPSRRSSQTHHFSLCVPSHALEKSRL